MMIEKENVLRSEKHRRIVAQLPCASCKTEGQSQAAHRNEGKGGAIKACDSQIFPMCHHCHTLLDQSGKLKKGIRRAFEKRLVDETRSELQARGQWADAVEAAFVKVRTREDHKPCA